MRFGIVHCLLIICFSSCSGVRNGLVAQYELDGNALDKTSNGNHGVASGVSPDSDRFGIAGSSLSFNGDGSGIMVKDSETLNPENGITLSAWIKPVSFAGIGNNSIIDKGYTTHEAPFYQYHLGITGNEYHSGPGKFVFALAINHQYEYILSDGTWSPGEWYLVTGTYNGQIMRIYVNGVLSTERYVEGKMERFGQPVTIGKTGSYTAQKTHASTPASMDDIRIYDRALLPKTIERLYILKR